MPVAKQILILITQIFFCTVCFAQREKIDSLKKVLPSLRDSARVDCLNALGETYSTVQIDTAEIFALKAFGESKRINYLHGEANAIFLKGIVASNKYNDYPGAEKLAREAIVLYAKTPNKKGLNRAYYELGNALYAQSYFEEALNDLDISFFLSKKANDTAYIFQSVTNSAYVYLESGDYKKTFEKVLELHELVLKNNTNKHWKAWESNLISTLYLSIEDYKTALVYDLQKYQIIEPDYYGDLIGTAELFCLNRQFDSAQYYYRLVDTNSSARALRSYLSSFGEYCFLQGQYEKALPNFLRALNYNKQVNDRNPVMWTLVKLARTYDSLHNYTSAFKYAHEALALAQETGARQFMRDCYQILYSVFDHWQQTDSAFSYYRKYVILKDSITSAQVAAKLVAYNFDQKIELLNKEKEVQQMQLQKQSLIKNFLIGTIIVLLLITIIIIRNVILNRRNEKQQLVHTLELQKVESEKTKAEFQQQATELEMQALRAQMNPHFIFNSLNSINRFILQNNREQASEYLTKFSRLVRMILQNSQASLITLESELDALKLYLEMEALRFNYHFDYKISISKNLDIEVLKVPPLILQPYVENAIWHGLMHKEEKGQLDIEVTQENDYLYFIITDDGIGRKKATELNSKSATTHKSVGLKITANRIAMMQHGNGTESAVTINDLANADGRAAGTEVIIKMPVIYD